MADTHKVRRIEDATDLIKKIQAFNKVPSDQRAELIHDRLMDAIDGICDKHKGETTGQIFTQRQLAVVKDVAFQVVFILDKKNNRPGLLRKGWNEFRSSDFSKQIVMVGGTLTIIGFLVAGVSSVSARAYGYFWGKETASQQAQGEQNVTAVTKSDSAKPEIEPNTPATPLKPNTD